MTLHDAATDTLLSVVVLTCWIGALGMWRMKQPIQALHYAHTWSMVCLLSARCKADILETMPSGSPPVLRCSGLQRSFCSTAKSTKKGLAI